VEREDGSQEEAEAGKGWLETETDSGTAGAASTLTALVCM
jgi:hypothetical protein